ncbi:MAG: 50S ribosomal protein L9 [Eggerthellaceae bacterium]|jgi:large subunit ribosomal protein L9|nr:50S ribosomal protein L9 [Eggerthellaceae bacterium]MCH4221537.1 50S ribosomal protein L9 [Eggerthellaceae bacterium]
MKVILLQELKGKGIEGDVVDVAPGFARNYLLPQKIAVTATSGNLKQLEQRRHNIEKREAERLTQAQDLHERLKDVVVEIDARVGEEGQLFGSVTTQMIADALKEQGIEVDRKRIDLKAPIKTAGVHEAIISIHRDVKSVIKVKVGNAETFAAAEAAEQAKEAAAAAEAVAEAADAVAGEAAEAAKAATDAAKDQK